MNPRDSMPMTTSRSFFFFNDTATTEIYTLSLHDALPISVEFGDHRLDRLVAHLVGVLEDERVDGSGPQVFDQVGARIEADEDDLARQALLLERLHDADGRGLVRGEEAVEVGVRRQDVGRAVERAGAVRFAVLEGHDLDAGVFGLDRLLETLLALVGRDRPGLDAEDGDAPLPVQARGQTLGRVDAALLVVGRDVGDVVLGADAGVEDGDGDALARGTLDDRDERVLGRGREHDAVHAAVDGVLDDVGLPRVVGLLRRPLPDDLDARLLPRGLRAGVDALPEEVRDALRDDGDGAPAAPAARPAVARGREDEADRDGRQQQRGERSLHVPSETLSPGARPSLPAEACAGTLRTFLVSSTLNLQPLCLRA